MSTGAGPRLAILNKLDDSLDFVDLATRSFIGSVPMPPHPHELVISPDGRTAYASIYGDGVYGNNVHPGHEIVVVDLATMARTSTIDTSPYSGTHGMALHPDGSLMVTCDNSNATIVLDPQDGQIVRTIDMPGHGGHFLAMTPDGTKAYVSNKDTAVLSVIDTEKAQVVRNIGVAEGTEGIALSTDATLLFAMSHTGSPLPNPDRPAHLSIYVIDTASDRVEDQIALPGLAELPIDADPESRISATPDGRYLLVAAFKWNTVVVVDAATLRPLTYLAVEPEPMHFTYSPDSPRSAYLSSHRAGRISRIDLETLTVVDTFPSTPTPRRGRPEGIAAYSLRPSA